MVSYFLLGLVAAVVLWRVGMFFYRRHLIIKAFRREQERLRELREIMRTSKDSEEIREAFKKYSDTVPKFKNY